MSGIPQQGWSQQTPAARAIISAGYSAPKRASTRRSASSRTGSRTRRKKRAGSSKKRKLKSAGKKLKRLVKGSAAAKAYMAKIRKKRK